jgi:hypothetical protein
MENLAGNSTAVELQIESPRGTQSENLAGTNASQKARGRQGGLGRERAQKAHAIRKIHACFHCWAHKIPVSEIYFNSSSADTKF